MDRALREARTSLAYGGAGVAALLASPDRIIGVARNTIEETGDLTNHAEMVLLRGVSRSFRRWMNRPATRFRFTSLWNRA